MWSASTPAVHPAVHAAVHAERSGGVGVLEREGRRTSELSLKRLTNRKLEVPASLTYKPTFLSSRSCLSLIGCLPQAFVPPAPPSLYSLRGLSPVRSVKVAGRYFGSQTAFVSAEARRTA